MIELEDVSWTVGGFGLANINLTVESGRYTVLMGPTGCGKTTVLEIVAGLRRPAAGRVIINGEDVTNLPPGKRRLGYVPQDGALFPTMTVRQQISFAPTLQGRSGSDIADTVNNLAAGLGIVHLLDRMPSGLSGGERQRVALGRALASKPVALILDEPLSALDEDTRATMLDLLEDLHRQHQLTALHVTHSRTEAERIGDKILHFSSGAILTGQPSARGLTLGSFNQ